MQRQAGRAQAEDGFSLVDMMATILVISIVAMLAVPQLVMAFDRGRQRRSMADMRNLAVALSTYHLDAGGSFPTTSNGLNALQPDYYAGIPDDGWGTDYLYVGVGSGCSYLLLGLGANTMVGPDAPDPWLGDSFEPDIWVVNSTFFQAPGMAGSLADIPSAISSTC